MILLTERIDEYFKSCLQKKIVFKANNKIFVSGKLILFKLDGFRILLTFDVGNETIKTEIPYPFNAFSENNDIILDYRFEALAEKNYNLLFLLQSMFKRKKAKFYNTFITISYE